MPSSSKLVLPDNCGFKSNMNIIEIPDIVNIATHTDIYEGNDKVEKQPDLYHLDIRGDRQAGYHRDVHADQDQHGSDVNRYCRFKVEWFEVVGDVSNNVEEYCWNINCCEYAEETATKIDQY